MVLFELRKKYLQSQLAKEKKMQAAKLKKLKEVAAREKELKMLRAESKRIKQISSKGLTPAERKILAEKKKRAAMRQKKIDEGLKKTGKVFSSILDDFEKFAKTPPKKRKPAKRKTKTTRKRRKR